MRVRTFPPLCRFASAVALCLGSAIPTAHAEGCHPADLPSSCVDTDNFWPHAGSATWATLGSTSLTAPGQVGFGLITSLQKRPLVFHTASADPAGADVAAIDHQLNVNYLFSYGVSRRFELTAALPVTLYQDGVGRDILSSQQPAPIVRTAFRDLRVGVTAALLARPKERSADEDPGSFAAVAHLQMAFPTGNQNIFARGAGPVVAPTVTGDYHRGRFFGGVEMGARLREAVSVGGTRIGSQALIALGAGVRILPRDLLAAQLEVFSLPSLVNQYTQQRDAGTGAVRLLPGGSASVPTEWLATLRTASLLAGDLVINAGFGTGIPLTQNNGTEPTYRFVFGLRYAPLGQRILP